MIDQVLQASLELLAFGDVLHLRDKVQRPAVVVADERDALQDPNQVPADVAESFFDPVGGGLAVEELAELDRVDRDVLRDRQVRNIRVHSSSLE